MQHAINSSKFLESWQNNLSQAIEIQLTKLLCLFSMCKFTASCIRQVGARRQHIIFCMCDCRKQIFITSFFGFYKAKERLFVPLFEQMKP